MTTRRDFIKSSGMLVVGISTMPFANPFDADAGQKATAGQGAGPYPDPDFRQLDSWIVVRQDNTATFYVGKTDLGQGTGTAFRQLMADELDMAYDSTSVVMGSTDVTVDQGGSGGSDALQTDGWPMRRVHGDHQGRDRPLVRPPGVRGAGRRDHHARGPRQRRGAASGAAGLDRRAGAAMRVLPERANSQG